MKATIIPLDYEAIDINDKNVIKITAKTANNKRIVILDEYEPNFYVILKQNTKKQDIEKLISEIEQVNNTEKTREAKVVKTQLITKKYLEEPHQVIQVFVNNHKDAQTIASEIGNSDHILARREYDISIITKYIIQKELNPLEYYEIEGEMVAGDDYAGIVQELNADAIIKLKSHKPSKKEQKYQPQILTFDIETSGFDATKSEVLMIAIYTDKTQKVFTHTTKENTQKHIIHCKDEAQTIQKFIEEVEKINPDIISGYYSDGFDMPFLKERCKQHKIPFTLGIDNSQVKFSRGNTATAKISGRVHIDIYKFISSVYAPYLSSESLSLDNVAHELIGSKKHEFDFTILKNKDAMTTEQWEQFAQYNIQDTKLTHQLLERIWPDIIEFTKIIKEPLFEITRNRMATHVENYILHHLKQFDEIAEKKPTAQEIGARRSLPQYAGAFVFEPTPGIYENIVFFDFTSMYASVIVTYNLSKATLINSQEPYQFKKAQGIFPSLLQEIINKRKEYKKAYAKKQDNLSKAASNAYKLLANASYGYLGFFGARYYSRQAAQETAAKAKENILTAIDKIEKKGFKILYSDTDSIAFEQGNHSKKEITTFLKELNEKLPGIMELDLEDFYTRGIFVAKRGEQTGAKKKYALMTSKGGIKIRGFETIRRDWCIYTRELQSKILRAILEDPEGQSALAIYNKAVKKLETGKVEIKDLIIKTQLKKQLKDYKAKGPHVIAAQKLKEQGNQVSTGMLIEYYISNKKAKNIGEKVLLPNQKGEYDKEYYLQNQIIPAIESIFDVLGIDIKKASTDKSQTTLF